MEELGRSDRVRSDQEGDVLVLEMPDGSTQRFRFDTEEERQRLCDALDALPEDWKFKVQDKAIASLGKDDLLPAPILLPNGKALFIW